MTDKTQIPDQWLLLKIGEVTDVVAGGTPKAGDPDNFAEPGTEIAWLTPADLSKYTEKYISYGARDLSPQGYQTSSAKLLPAGSLLFSSRAPIGYVAIAENEIATNQGFKNFVLPDGIDSSYGYYFLRSIRSVAESMGTGTTFKEISGANAKKLPFTLAPLAEQKAIADKLDTLLAQVETIKARLERIPKILKRFRQSVLAAAVSGRLTEEWRALASSPEWEIKTLGDVIGSIDQGWSPKCHNEPTSDESWGVIKTSSVLPMVFAEHENKKLPDSLDARPRLRILDSDILTTRAGPRSRCGVTCYVSGTSKNLMICDKVYRYRVIDGKGNSKFLALQLNSPSVLEKIEALKTGISESGMNLTQKKFRQLKIHWPTPKEQAEIVRRVDQLFAHADRIEQQVEAALERINNLTQSILAKAFRGELTEQWRKDNPELISGENSAAALLERIQTERATNNKARKTPRPAKKPS